MSEDERKKFMEEVCEKTGGEFKWSGAASLAAMGAQFGARAMGFATYQFALAFSNQMARQVLARGLAFATNTLLVGGVSFLTGPIGWVLSGAWFAMSLAGPSISATKPCVIQIATMRLKQTQEAILTGGVQR